MWFALFFAFIGLAILHALYFSRAILDAAEQVLPRVARWRRRMRWGYCILACSMPVLLLLYVAYVLLAEPDSFGFPESGIADILLIYPFWFATIWSFQCTLFILPLGLLHWGLRRAGFFVGELWTYRRSLMVLFIAGGFLVYIPVRSILDRNTLLVRHYETKIEELPAELDGFRIALVSDPQADRYTGEERLAEVVDAVAGERPDLVVIAGDIITRPPQYIDTAARQLGRLRAPHGVYACIGDHDNFAYRDRERSLREVREGLARYGIPMLDNDIVSIDVGAARVALIMATNNYVTRIGPGTTRKLIDRAKEADARLLLTHQTSPDLLGAARKGGVDIVLAGHTHGGQINFPSPFGWLIFANIETPYISGEYRLGGTKLIVSNGVGMSVAPFRYHAPASVEIITLRR